MSATPSPGRSLAEGIAAKDHNGLGETLAEDLDFRALTPGRAWESTSRAEVLEIMFGTWFDNGDHIDRLLEVTEGPEVSDTRHVRYRLAVSNSSGAYLVEQQAYYRCTGDRIDFLRVLCSGYRPDPRLDPR